MLDPEPSVGLFISGSLISGLIAFVGCSSNSSTTAGAGASTSSTSGGLTSNTSSASGTGGSQGTGGSTGGTGGSTSGTGGTQSYFACNIPATPPSKGSCVVFTASDAGELDAGVDDAGDPATTNCNPVTNAGCTGTDVCGPDFNDYSNVNYFCQPAGSPAGIAACGSCTANGATCGAGAICLPSDLATTVCATDADCPAGTPRCDTQVYQCAAFSCAEMCCTDADCGSGGMCNLQIFQLPSSVGVCFPM